MSRVKHINNGNCPKCEEIFNEYDGFYPPLKEWFKQIQRMHPDAHISDAGRGRDEQERYKQRGASRASFGQSAHNYNAAIDIFELRNGRAAWDKKWFEKVVGKNLDSSLTWYGSPGSSFYELPHVQAKDWKGLAREGLIMLVEEPIQGDPAITPQPSKPVVMPPGRQDEEVHPTKLENAAERTRSLLSWVLYFLGNLLARNK